MRESKPCIYCGTHFQKPPAYGRKFGRRLFCSQECSRAKRSDDATKSYTSTTMVCQHCGEAFAHKGQCSVSKFRKRKYCSTRCAYGGIDQLTPTDPRPCERCGLEMARRTGEKLVQWRVRKYCSQDSRLRQAWANPFLKGDYDEPH
jgi:hypothetical protein